jgi:muconolactone delta-isomerase
MKLLPKEQEILHGLEADGTVVHHFIKLDMSGIYMVVMAADEDEVHTKLATLPYYPYMTIEIVPIRAVNHINA